MNEHHIRRLLEGDGGAAGTILRGGLWLPGKLYGAAMRLRRHAYRRGWLADFTPAVPVVSVGNLTAGGSGKTPFVAMLANYLADRGKRPAILLRGYRRADDGRSDEETLYAELCPRANVQANPDRRAGAARALAAGADVLLMDDGFQHLRLRRDLDIVLVDSASPWGGGNVVPGGLLREPLSALAQADIVVATRSDQVDAAALDSILGRVRRLAPDAAIFTARHAPSRLRALDGSPRSLDSLDGRAVVALSGIARPEAFEKTLTSLGARIVGSFQGTDHRDFNPELVSQALEQARVANAVILTTEKDQAKNLLSVIAACNSVDTNSNVKDLWVLGVRQEVDGEQKLLGLVDAVVG